MSLVEKKAVLLTVPEAWERVFEEEGDARCEAALPEMLARQRWFGGKARRVATARLIEAVRIPTEKTRAIVLLIEVVYGDGAPERYVLPVTAAFGDEAERVGRDRPQAILARLKSETSGRARSGVLYDALWDEAVAQAFLRMVGRGGRVSGRRGSLVASPTAAYPSLVPAHGRLAARVMKAEQSNTSVVYGSHAILKLYRRVQPGVNPDLEIGRMLTAMAFPHSARVGGSIEYVPSTGEPMTIGILQQFIPNQGDAWSATVKAVEAYLSRVPAEAAGINPAAGTARTLWELAQEPLPQQSRQLLGPDLDAAACLGRRTAALHLALAEAGADPGFTPEPMTEEYRRTRHDSMCRLWKDTALLLERRRDALPARVQDDVTQLMDRAGELQACLRAFLGIRDGGLRIRCHGDYHLGQVLWTGSDYVIIDFEGEPARPLSERRTKHAPLLDVAGMLRSLHYASCAALAGRSGQPAPPREPWAELWFRWVGAEFLRAYLAETRTAAFRPPAEQTAEVLLTVHMLEKAVYELGYELNNRPEWVAIPLKGMLHILNMNGARAAGSTRVTR